jgi:predicted HicB family RNase H-like nuclease
MMYRGYTAHYEFDREDGILHGRVEGIRDVVTFQADRVEDLEREFQTSVDFYLDHCARKGRLPDQPGEPPKRAVS